MDAETSKRILRFLFLVAGVLGGVFILYGLWSALTGETFKPLETIALPLSSALTVLGAIVTAGSIYVFQAGQPHPADAISREATAPAVIVMGIVALAVLYRSGSLPPVAVNGFSMMAIAGGLLRTQPRPAGW